MKRLSFIIVLCGCLLITPCIFAQEDLRYFNADELPDLIKCLPAPPDSLSQAFSYDVMRYMWGKAQRQNPDRVAQVKRDAVWTYEALIDEFDDIFGLELSKKKTPEIWKLLESSLQTVDQIRVAPKAYFHRIRPFEFFGDTTLTGEDDILRGEGSYPSGHTIRSWLVATLLSEINPLAANDLYARAWRYGENRVIAGAHWQSDIDVSRSAAAIGYVRLQTSVGFRMQMARAQNEFRRLY